MMTLAEPTVAGGAASNRPPQVQVLVVDDNPVDRLRVGRLIERDPACRAVYAANGLEALDRLVDHAIAVVLTDLQMDGMDGLELVRAVRRDHAGVPVILMTAHGSEDAAMEALRVGASDYILKHKLARELASVLARPLRTAAAGSRRLLCLRSMVRQEMTYEIGNDLELIPSLLDILRDEMTRLGRPDSSDLMRTIVAVDEALRNAVCHGNLEVSSSLREEGERRFDEEVRRRAALAPYRDRRVRLRVIHDPGRSTFVIRDEGPGFDTSRIGRTIEPEDLLRSSGRGLLLMKSFMDQVIFNKTGNQVTLIKRRYGEAATLAAPEAGATSSPAGPLAVACDVSRAPGSAAADCDPAAEAESTPASAGVGAGESDFYRRLVDQLHVAVYLVDRSGRIVYWNEAAERLTGHTAAEVVGRRCTDGLIDAIDDRGRPLCDHGCPLVRAISDRMVTQERIFLRTKDGRTITVDARSFPVLGEGGVVLGAAQTFTDATSELVAQCAFRQVREAADTDPLTTLANRRYFDRVLGQHLADLRRSPGLLSLIMADLDHFKRVNDTWGHAVGDDALVRFADLLRLHCRPMDLIIRYGGEEFIVLLPGADVIDTAQIAERLREATPDATPTAMGAGRLSASFGVVQAIPGESAADLLKRADAALYRAKAQGRDRVEVGVEEGAEVAVGAEPS